MALDDLARRLANPDRIGLNEDVARRLGIASEDVTRGRLMAQLEGDQSHLGVYLLACYVVDDTDFWGDGEIYWWCVPAIVDQEGLTSKDPLSGIPTGDRPHKVGSLEWMTNISLADPPLLGVIPPGDQVSACVLRLGFYDDDRAPADVPAAITAGLEAYAALPSDPLAGPEQLVTPVRQAIWQRLAAHQDDILLDQDVILRRGEESRFGVGMVGYVVNARARIYYFVTDEARTERFGPITLHKGQSETVMFRQRLDRGGRLALFARGADIHCAAFGDLSTDQPFLNRVLDLRQEASLERGFEVTGRGPAKLVAYYTPP